MLAGTKKYILGDEPCDVDCSIFGMLAQVRWHMITSPIGIYMRGTCTPSFGIHVINTIVFLGRNSQRNLTSLYIYNDSLETTKGNVGYN